MKVKFSKRVLAYIIDIIIVGLIGIILTTFVPTSEKQENLYKQSKELSTNYADGKIDVKEYNKRYKDINYDLSKETVIPNVISIVTYIVYFVIFQIYKEGQTIGKKIMKIKLRSIQSDKIDTNALLIRTLLLYGLWSSIINQVLILFVNKNTYTSISTILNVIQISILFSIIITSIIRKDGRGIHDIISKTEVIECN